MAPIRANVFIMMFCCYVFDVRTPPTRDVNPVKVRGPTGLYARDSGTDSANGGWRLDRGLGHHFSLERVSPSLLKSVSAD